MTIYVCSSSPHVQSGLTAISSPILIESSASLIQVYNKSNSGGSTEVITLCNYTN